MAAQIEEEERQVRSQGLGAIAWPGELNGKNALQLLRTFSRKHRKLYQELQRKLYRKLLEIVTPIERFQLLNVVKVIKNRQQALYHSLPRLTDLSMRGTLDVSKARWNGMLADIRRMCTTLDRDKTFSQQDDRKIDAIKLQCRVKFRDIAERSGDWPFHQLIKRVVHGWKKQAIRVRRSQKKSARDVHNEAASE
ncbi:hypothetical protein BKA69DRAFT_1173153 [Paraphysoderma sedebokerense]|nr:hypothetical protein BKA69DRAFT_1173153 [Paraphysoderma sedebokerense]